MSLTWDFMAILLPKRCSPAPYKSCRLNVVTVTWFAAVVVTKLLPKTVCKHAINVSIIVKVSYSNIRLYVSSSAKKEGSK